MIRNIKNYITKSCIEDVKSWTTKLMSHSEQNLVRLNEYSGDELDKMTLKEVTMVLDYILATYSLAYQRGYKDALDSYKLNAEQKKVI